MSFLGFLLVVLGFFISVLFILVCIPFLDLLFESWVVYAHVRCQGGLAGILFFRICSFGIIKQVLLGFFGFIGYDV